MNKILIAEDDEVTLELLENKLKLFGYKIPKTVQFAEEILDAAILYNPNLILIDINLKGDMSGIEAALITRHLNIPILFITSSTDEDSFEQILRTDYYGFIPKPIDFHSLKFTIKMALYKHKSDMEFKEILGGLKNHRNQLEKLIAERTSQLEQVNVKLLNLIREKQDIENEIISKNITMTEELDAACNVQKSLLPDIPISKYMKIDYRYEPMSSVGGDIISIRELQESGGYGIFIGDITGHGVSAALLSTLINNIADRICRKYGTNAKLYITELNKAMLHEMPEDDYLTGIYLYIKKEKDHLSIIFSGAAHPYPILYEKKNKKFHILKYNGKPIGFLKESEYEEINIKMYPGDKLFLYTDGLYEILNKENNMLDLDGFIEIISDSVRMNLEIGKTLEKIMNDVENFGNSHTQKDDKLLVIIEAI